MKKIFISILFLFLFTANFSLAQEQKETEVYFFWGQGCPHCAKESEFLDEMEEKYPTLIVKRFEIYNSRSNFELLEETKERYDADYINSVPVLFIDSYNPVVGYRSDIITGASIEEKINFCVTKGCLKPSEVDMEKKPGREVEEGSSSFIPEKESRKEENVDLPLFGEVNVSESGLLIFSAMVGILDGFNACAMWSLCFLLTFLVSSGSRKRVFIIGGTFIFVSGLVYFIFMSAWMNLFIFVGYLDIIRIILSILAIIFGIVCIKDFFAFGKGISFILPEKTRDKIVERMKKLTKPGLALGATILGVSVLAFVVNLIEVLCTTGFPAIYTKILTSHNLSSASYYFYLLVYIFFYMLDDFIIFSIAVLTLRSNKFERKYGRLSKLISGIIILLLGLIMIFKPDLLMFG